MERKKFPVPPAANVNIPNMLPVNPGKIIGRIPAASINTAASEISEVELQYLQNAMRYDGGGATESIPEELQLQISQLAEKAADISGLSPIDPSTPPLEMPTPVDINDLPPDERIRAEQMFREMDELNERITIKRLERQNTKMNDPVLRKPGAAAAMAAVAAAETARISEENTAQKAMPFKLRDEPAEKEYTEIPPSTKPEYVENTEDQSQHTDIYCPRCNHDINGELVVPTDDDIVAYLAMLMGNDCFRKRVSLFGNRIGVVFRSLSPREEDAAVAQVDKEVSEGKIHHPLHYVRAIEEYKMAIGIESLSRTGGVTTRMPQFDRIEAIGDKPPVVQLRDYLRNDVLTTESLRRVVGTQWSRFNQLLQYLEANAENPDFFGNVG